MLEAWGQALWKPVGHITPLHLHLRSRPHQPNQFLHLPQLMLTIHHLALWMLHWKGCHASSGQTWGGNPKGMPTSQATSPIRALAQIVPTTGSVVKLTGPLIPSDQMEDKRQYILIVTALVRRLNLETTGVILRETVTTLVGEWPLRTPKWLQFFLDSTGQRGWWDTQAPLWRK